MTEDKKSVQLIKLISKLKIIIEIITNVLRKLMYHDRSNFPLGGIVVY